LLSISKESENEEFRGKEIDLLIEIATVEHRKLRVENQTLRQEIRRRTGSGRPIGESSRWIDVLKLAETVAPTDSTVLLQGESGTGKEVVARYIHDLSTRTNGAFLSINCGALPESLLESELFGHVKGSFTGAVKDKVGLFAAASGGTFFLDEVGEMAPATQVKLLRTLQQREVLPVGATEAISVDARLIAATNRDLERDVKTGQFRSDLFYRLNVIAIHLPPLRDQGVLCYCDDSARRCAILRVPPVPCEGDFSCAVSLAPRPHPVAADAAHPHQKGRACRDFTISTTCERTNICTMNVHDCPDGGARR